MSIISPVIAIFVGLFGIYLGFRAFNNFGHITKGKISLGFIVMNSIIAGGCGFLLFFSIIMVMGFLDEVYVWTIKKFYGAIFISLIPGLIVAIGSFIQSILIAGYRGILHDFLKKKDRGN